MEILTTSNIMFILGCIGTVIGVYKSINNPQKDLEKNQALNEEKDKNKATVLAQKEIESRAELLAQQALSDKEDNNRRFTELGDRIDKSMTLAQNHIHTVDIKVENISKELNLLVVQITKLGTIIEERMPRSNKKVIY